MNLTQQNETQRTKIWPQEMNRASVIYGTTLCGLLYVRLEFLKEWRKKGRQKKIIEEIMTQTFPDLMKPMNAQIQEAQ